MQEVVRETCGAEAAVLGGAAVMQDLLAQLCACVRDASLLSLQRCGWGMEKCEGGGDVVCMLKLLQE